MKWNNKDLTPEEAKALLENPETIVQSLSIEINNVDKDKSAPLTMEGFDIPKDLIIHLAERMDKINGSKISFTFSNCGKLMNKTVTLTITNPDHIE